SPLEQRLAPPRERPLVPPARALPVRMRARPEPHVLAAAPVEQVVPALAPGARPVRDLVLPETGAGEGFAGELVLRELLLVVDLADEHEVPLLRERRPLLEDQAVAGHVLGPEIRDPREVAGEGLPRAARDSVDQVEVHVRKPARPQ